VPARPPAGIVLSLTSAGVISDTKFKIFIYLGQKNTKYPNMSKRTIAVIAPMIDQRQFHREFRLLLKGTQRELTLATLQELAQNSFRTDTIVPFPSRKNIIPAAGFYLAGLLRENGYDVTLTQLYDDETLQSMALKNPFAVCLSSTMILTTESLKILLKKIRYHFPESCIIVGGIFIWKSYQFYEMNLKYKDLGDFTNFMLFYSGDADIDADIFIAAPHGRESLLMVLKNLESGRKADFNSIPNLVIPDKSGSFTFTKRTIEEVDYNTDYTRWDLIDESPDEITIRTSIGCPYRCRYCDFYKLYPKIFFRSKDSLVSELKMITNRFTTDSIFINVTDDNVFINKKRIEEVTDALISTGIPQWMGFMRASTINESNIKHIQESRLLLSMIGVESGDKGQLERMNKSQNLEDVKRGIELLDQHGIMAMMTFIVGFPGETPETLNNTAHFINNLNIGIASSSYQLLPLIVTPFCDLSEPEYRRKWKIKGLWENWTHYTMNFQEAKKSSYELFKKVSSVPYHYIGERMFYNRRAFTDAQRKKLFQLRNKLTIAMIENWSQEKKIDILYDISATIGITGKEINQNFIEEIQIPV